MSTIGLEKPRSLPAEISYASVGKKVLMAVTGLVAFAYVLGHMLGNLQIFAGRERLNDYAEFLHSLGWLLWVIRVFLFAFFVIHVWKGIQLKLENWASRPQRYVKNNTVQASLSSRTMIWTGLAVLSFVVYHILHFTVRITNPQYQKMVDDLGRPDVYSMVITGYQNNLIAVVYIIAVGLVCYHLTHGIASMFQTVGLNNPRFQPVLDKIAWTLAVLIFLGFISIPLGVMFGILQLPGGGL
ncbi:MAG: succinate dehydrogenase cytochrome b subunit [candidate division Zixibacteria bacterium]|nr:succinate dehydrogenase cytochrome b subunit [candidate division Zixibacteria bacterium]